MIPKYLEQLFAGQQYDPKNFFLIAGPCVVESEENVFEIGAHLSAVCKRLQIPLVLKASYRKANRTSASSFTGHGDLFGLGILQKAGVHFGLPSTTDVHSEIEAAEAAKFVDILQIPAFL
ncbi:MAG: 3-deoxy-8-phosphooctulonate synthase, partial [Chitinophagaceae bacterium]